MFAMLALHILAAVIWVGGMFFAYQCLRPAAGKLLEPPARLTLWDQVFRSFFKWVWLSIAFIVLTGHGMIAFYGGFGSVGMHVHIMLGLGYLMVALYAFMYFARYRKLSEAVAVQDWAVAGGYLAKIRHIVAVNLVLGLITVAVAAGGKFLL